MSHAPERTEKNCLNCGATVIGRFCHICGQENIVPKESFGKLALHFFYDITHFDGKFFDSLRYLLFRPGFLSKEYVRGKRTSYLNPVRMYVFTSAIFFLIFFMITGPEELMRPSDNKVYSKSEKQKKITDLEKEYQKGEHDTSVLLQQIALLKDTSRAATPGMLQKIELDDTILYPETFAQYEAGQKALPDSQKASWVDRMIVKKLVYAKGARKNPTASLEKWAEVFFHQLPYLLFVSLPFFALILKLLYVRRGKEFYYADHAIFSIHHYILSFFLLLICFLFGTVYDMTGMKVFRIILLFFLFGVWPIHLYLAMLNFYKQKWFKTFVKFFLLNVLGFITIIILFGIFFLISLIQL